MEFAKDNSEQKTLTRALVTLVFFIALQATVFAAPPETPQSEVFQPITRSLIGPARGHQRNPAVVAFSGSWLVVWDDKRNGNEDIYGAIVGNRNDGGYTVHPSFPIASPAGDQKRPAICRLGAGALVAWEDSRNSSTGRRDIYAAFVGVNASVTPLLGLPVDVGPGSDKNDVELIAFDEGALAVWEVRDDPTRPNGLYGMRFAPDGSPLDPTPILIHEGEAWEPAIAGTGSTALVVWQSLQSRISAKLITWANVLEFGSEMSLIESHGDNAEPAVAWDGQYFLVAWANSGLSGQSHVAFRRIDADGQMIDSQPTILGEELETNSLELLSITTDSFTILTATSRSQTSKQLLHTQSINFNGITTIGSRTILDTGSLSQPQDPASAGIGSSQLIVWEDEKFEHGGEHGEEIMARRLFRYGGEAPRLASLISTATTTSPQLSIATVCTGSNASSATAFVASGYNDDFPEGIFISNLSTSDAIAYGPVLTAPVASNYHIAWLTNNAPGNARVIDTRFQPYFAIEGAFERLSLNSLGVSSLAAIGTTDNYDGTHNVWIESLPTLSPNPNFIPAAKLIGTINKTPDAIAAIVVGLDLYISFPHSDNTTTFARHRLGDSTLTSTTIQLGYIDVGSQPTLLTRGNSAELIWHDQHLRRFRFSNWPTESPAPSATFSSDADVGNFFTTNPATQQPTAVWEGDTYFAQESPPRWVRQIFWQEINQQGQPSGERFSTPIQPSSNPSFGVLAAGFQQPSPFKPASLVYLRKTFQPQPFSLFAEQAELAPLTIDKFKIRTDGDYDTHWTGTIGADVEIEESTDLIHWQSIRFTYVSPFSAYHRLETDSAQPNAKKFVRLRYVIP